MANHYLIKTEVMHLLSIFENLYSEMNKDDIAVIFKDTPDLDSETTVHYNKAEVKSNRDLLAIHLEKMIGLEELLPKEIEELNSVKDGNVQTDIIIKKVPYEIREMVENVYTQMMSKYDLEKMKSCICRM